MKKTRILLSLLILSFLLSQVSQAQMRANKLGVGASGSMMILMSDDKQKNNKTSLSGGLDLSYSLFEYISLRGNFSYGQFLWENLAVAPALKNEKTTLIQMGGAVSLDMAPQSSFNPFIMAGSKFIYLDPTRQDGSNILGAGQNKTDIVIFGGGGADIFFSEFISLSLYGEYVMANTFNLNGPGTSTAKESYVQAGASLRYYFFDQTFMTKMLDALKKRYES